MIKSRKTTLIFTSVLTLLPCFAGILLWDKLPDKMAVNFDIQGNPNDWESKEFAVFALPLLMIAVHWFCVLLTASRKEKQNSKILELCLWLCPCISILCNTAIYCSALEIEFNAAKIISVFLGIVFIIIGNIMPKISQNKTVGFRTPWTVVDTDNWYYTHRIAGKIWVAGGIVMFVAAIAEIHIAVPLAAAIMILVPFYCSYKFHKKKTER